MQKASLSCFNFRREKLQLLLFGYLGTQNIIAKKPKLCYTKDVTGSFILRKEHKWRFSKINYSSFVLWQDNPIRLCYHKDRTGILSSSVFKSFGEHFNFGNDKPSQNKKSVSERKRPEGISDANAAEYPFSDKGR